MGPDFLKPKAPLGEKVQCLSFTKDYFYKNNISPEKTRILEDFTKLEDIRPSLEPAHAWSECIRLAPKLKKSDVLVVNNCGKGYKDKKIYIEQLGYYPK